MSCVDTRELSRRVSRSRNDQYKGPVAEACWGCPWKVKGASVGGEEREGSQRG